MNTRRDFLRTAGGGLAGYGLGRALPPGLVGAGVGSALLGRPRAARAQGTRCVELSLPDISGWTELGGQPPFVTSTEVQFRDLNPSDVSALYMHSDCAAPGIAVDVVASFRYQGPPSPNNADGGFRIVINDGQSRSAVLACALLNGTPYLSLAQSGSPSEPATYGVGVAFDWLTQPVEARLRRLADGSAQLVTVNGDPPGQTVFLAPDMVAGRTRLGASFEFGCTSVEGTASVDVTGFYAETTVATTPFASLAARADIWLGPGRAHDRFDLQALATLAAGSDGFDPLTEDVTISLGPGQWTIPAGSFRAERGGWYAYRGVIGTTGLSVSIAPWSGGRVLVAALGAGASLDGVANPVGVGLTLGDDAGETGIFARILPRSTRQDRP